MLQDILDKLIEIESQLDDAYYSLPEYNANTDSQSYIDGARCDVYNLKDDIERAILDENQNNKPRIVDDAGVDIETGKSAMPSMTVDRATLDENQKVSLDEVMNTSPTLIKGL